MKGMFVTMFRDKSQKDKMRRLYNEYAKLMRNYARKMLGDSYKAEDIVQDVFVNLSGAIDKIDEPSDRTRALMLIAVRNMAIDKVRKANGMEEDFIDEDADFVDTSTNVEEIVISKDAYDRLVGKIKSMDPKYGDLLMLKEVNGYSNQEISQMLGMKVATVRQRILRANKMLRKELEKDKLREDEY